MSSNILCNICPEAKDGHSFHEARNVAVLKRNSEAGCQLCSLISHALESLHGSWFQEYDESIEFRRFLAIDHTLVFSK